MVKLQIKTAVRPRQNRFKQYCMAQGVITATKAYYHASVVCKYIDVVEKTKAAPKIFIVLDAMMILTGACHKVMPETIQNCFKKAGICSKVKQRQMPLMILTTFSYYFDVKFFIR